MATRSPGSIVSGDAVALAGGTATFDTKNVGNAKTVTLSGAALTGAAADNYVLDGVSTTTANVTARALAIAAIAADKTYDGNATASVTFTDDRVAGDLFQVAYGSATFNNALAGTNKPVTVTGISISGVDAGNYVANTSASSAATIFTRDALVRYIGQTSFVTSGTSSTTAQVTLTASVQDPSGVGLVNATVDFIDAATGKALATGVKVSSVAGTLTGTANTVVTLSTGQYGSQLYNILVKLTGNYDNDGQAIADKTAQVVVSKPAATNEIIGGGTITSTASTAGSLAASGVTTWSMGLAYNKAGTNVQGQVALSYRMADGSLVTIKSNSLSSMAVSGKTATVYAKASVNRTAADGTSLGGDGNVTLRVDVSSVNGVNRIGFTVLSTKDSTLYYASEWVFDTATKTWKTRATTVNGGSTLTIN